MSFTNDNDLEVQQAGQADWDTGLNSNFQILERGFTFRALAGIAVASASIIWLNNSGYAFPYDPRSLDLKHAHGMSRLSVGSGGTGLFTHVGITRSLSVGSLVMGQPVYACPDPASLGLHVASYAGADFPVGVALALNAILINPGKREIPELVTIVTSGVAATGASSAFNFAIPIGHRGIIRDVTIQANSVNVFDYKLLLHSGSARVSSERVYETLTRSYGASGSSDVASSYFRDAAGFPFKNTDVASWALLFGRVVIQGNHSVTSGTFGVTVIMERFR